MSAMNIMSVCVYWQGDKEEDSIRFELGLIPDTATNNNWGPSTNVTISLSLSQYLCEESACSECVCCYI